MSSSSLSDDSFFSSSDCNTFVFLKHGRYLFSCVILVVDFVAFRLETGFLLQTQLLLVWLVLFSIIFNVLLLIEAECLSVLQLYDVSRACIPPGAARHCRLALCRGFCFRELIAFGALVLHRLDFVLALAS